MIYLLRNSQLSTTMWYVTPIEPFKSNVNRSATKHKRLQLWCVRLIECRARKKYRPCFFCAVFRAMRKLYIDAHIIAASLSSTEYNAHNGTALRVGCSTSSFTRRRCDSKWMKWVRASDTQRVRFIWYGVGWLYKKESKILHDDKVTLVNTSMNYLKAIISWDLTLWIKKEGEGRG